MFPRMRQRLLIVLAVLLGAISWLSIRHLLRAPDGSGGITLAGARVGLLAAVALAAVAGVPSLVLGVIVSATGNPLSGVFAASAALTALAIAGGSIDGWLYALGEPGAAAPPTVAAGYGWLMAETAVWLVGLGVMLTVTQRLRSPLRTRWPALAFSDHLGIDTHLWMPRLQSLLGGLICAAVAGVACSVLIRDSDVGQVTGALVLGFGLGGLAAYTVVPHSHPIGILLSPALVALVAYAYAMYGYDSPEALRAAWYARELPGIALVLPIFYASAGVAGCTLGVGLAQTLRAEHPGVDEPPIPHAADAGES